MSENDRREVRTVAVCTLNHAEWADISLEIMRRAEELGLLRWVKRREGMPSGDIVSTLGVMGVGPGRLPQRLYFQERRIRWVSAGNAGLCGHSFRAVRWSGVSRTGTWISGVRGAEKQRRDYAEMMIATGLWDEKRLIDGWNQEHMNMTTKQVMEWLGLVEAGQ
jgi:hypothetical protein